MMIKIASVFILVFLSIFLFIITPISEVECANYGYFLGRHFGIVAIFVLMVGLACLRKSNRSFKRMSLFLVVFAYFIFVNEVTNFTTHRDQADHIVNQIVAQSGPEIFEEIYQHYVTIGYVEGYRKSTINVTEKFISLEEDDRNTMASNLWGWAVYNKIYDGNVATVQNSKFKVLGNLSRNGLAPNKCW